MLYWFWDKFIDLLGAIKWDWVLSKPYKLKPQDWVEIQSHLRKGYYIILTRRETHLTTYLINLAYWLRTFKWGYWSHSVCNFESGTHFKLVEATSKGVTWSDFKDVFNCDSAVLLKPKYFTDLECNAALANIKDDIGKPYDDLFDFQNDQRLSCVEVWYHALKPLPGSAEKMRSFNGMLETGIKINPQDLYECDDFEVVLEIRR